MPDLFGREPKQAILSGCGRYRYALWRVWDEGCPTVLFVMLNPSTADAAKDDPTIRRCVGFAKSWGFGSLAVGNLFALRATSPAVLYDAADPVGPENDRHLLGLMDRSAFVVAAWGNHGIYRGRDRVVRSLRPGWHSLGLTLNGQPKHPLYLSATTVPTPWEP